MDNAYKNRQRGIREGNGGRIIMLYERNKSYKWLFLFGGCIEIWKNSEKYEIWFKLFFLEYKIIYEICLLYEQNINDLSDIIL